MVVDRSNDCKKDDRAARKQHIGYWLVGDGVPELELSVAYRAPLTERLHSVVKRYPTAIYLGALSLLTWLCMMPTFRYAESIGALQSVWSVVLLPLSVRHPGVRARAVLPQPHHHAAGQAQAAAVHGDGGRACRPRPRPWWSSPCC